MENGGLEAASTGLREGLSSVGRDGLSLDWGAGMTTYESKTADEVGEYFDDRSWLFGLSGFNLHIGYFDDEKPDTDPKERHTEVMIEAAELGAGSRLLDVGCGFGRPAVAAAKTTGAQVLGINVSAEQVRQGQKLAEEAGVSELVSFEQADGMALPYPDGSFDAVWASEAIMYMSDRPKALREIERVLVPGGRFVLSDYAEREDLSDEQRTALKEGFTVEALPTIEGYRGLLLDAGLEITRFEDATAHLHRSAARIPEVLDEKYAYIAERGGKEFADEFKEMLSKVGVLEGEVLGYVIAVGRKAAEPRA
ncbi:27-O-demethylrifamycin SV methyltransferase [Streptomyces sp. CMC78]|uniref:27-O-demethylrifamycin SV methyltransferase n=2 Tax=Streptomyces TaxID=1883 RepID=A0AB33KIB4_9ACTN